MTPSEHARGTRIDRREWLLAALGALPLASAAAGYTDPFVGPWLAPRQRRRVRNLDIALLDHAARRSRLATWCDRPLLLTFFYTRCDNASKCSTTISLLALLQSERDAAGLREQVRLLALSHEPQFDTPARLHGFATDRGLRLGPDALLAAAERGAHERLTRELGTPVNFSAGWVNTHGVQAVLLDRHARPVRCYSTILWDNRQVMKDFRRLLAEDA